MKSGVYETLTPPSIHLPVHPIIRPQHATAAGLLLSAMLTGDRSTAAATRHSAATTREHGTQLTHSSDWDMEI